MKILKESKNIGNIYHFCSNLRTVLSIIKNEELISSKNDEKNFEKNTTGEFSFSFTRDKNLKGFKSFKYGIIFDGEALSEKYKIKPYQYDRNKLLEKSVRYIAKVNDKYFLNVWNYHIDNSTVNVEKLFQLIEEGNNDIYGVVINNDIYDILKNSFLKIDNKYKNKDRLINNKKREIDLLERAIGGSSEGLSGNDFTTYLDYLELPKGKLSNKLKNAKNELDKLENSIKIFYKEFDNGNEIIGFYSRTKDNTVTGSTKLKNLYEMSSKNIDELVKYIEKNTFNDSEERIWADDKKYIFTFTDQNGKTLAHLSIKPYSRYVRGIVLPRKEWEEVKYDQISTKYLQEIVDLLPSNEYKYLLKE